MASGLIQPEPVRLRSYLPALVLIFVSTLFLAVLQFKPDQAAGAQVGVIFPPGTALSDSIGRVSSAGGTAIRVGAFTSIVIAQSHQAAFVGRLLDAGAVLVVNPQVCSGRLFPDGSLSDQTRLAEVRW